MTSTYTAGGQEFEVGVPSEIRVQDAKIQQSGSTITIELRTEGSTQNVNGPTTIEVYFDAKGDDMIQSRVVVATFGGYRFGDLPGDGTAAVYLRSLDGHRIAVRKLGTANVKLARGLIQMSANLGAPEAQPDIVIIRYASPDVWTRDPYFRFAQNGIAASILFRADEIRGRPLPQLPDHPDGGQSN